MQQTFIYEYLGFEQDPLLCKIKGLNSDEMYQINGVLITKNTFGLIEVNKQGTHEAFKDPMTCYKYLCDLLGDWRLLS
ncbi:hypothetical protein FH966_14800 [Lentibacillus cibarius]|uniref:Uncharacterized protein n=1 Tax=Lentibacillus cibarius TaxID=2583219 RepID=A0A549YLU6_9BACI|nr:hypothetical protein [Lentibacillus cibarius]TRM08769.1 hypothetical protein FH966_16465 [Lentibacillus cibarius]TRM08797.1 hypothetical protein FH966_16615 [Lentibacillus cibarius]TRM12871.1 hypothetical protein FH966_14800 [Lentibacillus cibarius]